MTLRIIEPSERHAGPILVVDENNNDVAEFFHNEHATVAQSYEDALIYAQVLAAPASPPAQTIATAIAMVLVLPWFLPVLARCVEAV